MTLPFDFTRCLDSDCPSREVCERWLSRETGHRGTPFMDTGRTDDNQQACDLFVSAHPLPRTANVRP